MIDFALLLHPHRAARKLPKAGRFAAAVDWAEIRLRLKFPDAKTVVKKLRTGTRLTPEETQLAIGALAPNDRAVGRPRTRTGRNLTVRLVINEVAREFHLERTRNNFPGKQGQTGPNLSAADAVAAALSRIGIAPRDFDRVRKLHAQAKSEEEAMATQFLLAQKKERLAAVNAAWLLVERLKGENSEYLPDDAK